MIQNNRFIFIVIVISIIIFTLNKIAGVILSNKIEDKIERVFTKQNFTVEKADNHLVFRNIEHGIEISYNDIYLNPINASLTIYHPILKITNDQIFQIELESLIFKSGYSQIIEMKKKLDSGKLGDISITEFNMIFNNIDFLIQTSELNMEITLEKFILDFEGETLISNVQNIMGLNNQTLDISLTNLKCRLPYQSLIDKSVIDFEIGELNIDKWNIKNNTENNITKIDMELKTNLLNLDLDTSFDNIRFNNLENIKVYNGEIVIRPIDSHIIQLIKNLEMKLGEPFPKNDKNDIFLEVIPGVIGNLKIKGLNFY